MHPSTTRTLKWAPEAFVSDIFTHRVAVDRARDHDVLLRHPSVSKFHAWFEPDDRGGMTITMRPGNALHAKEPESVGAQGTGR